MIDVLCMRDAMFRLVQHMYSVCSSAVLERKRENPDCLFASFLVDSVVGLCEYYYCCCTSIYFANPGLKTSSQCLPTRVHGTAGMYQHRKE